MEQRVSGLANRECVHVRVCVCAACWSGMQQVKSSCVCCCLCVFFCCSTNVKKHQNSRDRTLLFLLRCPVSTSSPVHPPFFSPSLPPPSPGPELLELPASSCCCGPVGLCAPLPRSLPERRRGRKTAITALGAAGGEVESFACCDPTPHPPLAVGPRRLSLLPLFKKKSKEKSNQSSDK